ncbi:MAG: amidohydrolase family protein, partial [Deltaproteobacteria bacterium]|nr:amidohydrolase family protein [Deltaproteobacteria bacterium]
PRLLLEGRIWPNAEGPAPGVSGPFTDKARKPRPGMTDPHQRLKDMDLEGIDVAVIFGTQIALTVNGLMNKDLAAALCHAVNEWLIDYCSADPTRLRAVGLIPCQDPPAAVRELQYLAKRDVLTAMLPNNVYGINMGDPMFDPIFAEAQELDIPLCVHPQTGHDGIPGVSGVMGAGSERFLKYVYVHMTAFPFELMIAMMHMIGEGVFDRYPRLKVGFMEGGAGWLPYWMERMDEEWEKRGKVEAPLCKKRPSEYLSSDQFYYGCEPEEKMMGYVVGEIGSESLMYASDYPHWDMSWPESGVLIWQREELSLEAKRNILGENARRFYNLS